MTPWRIPEGHALREDLACPRCNRPVLERIDGSTRTYGSGSVFVFSCVGYWGNGRKCWTCASPLHRMAVVGEQQTLF